MNHQQKTTFEQIQKKVFELMNENLSSDLYYHNLEHTQSVIKATEWLCDLENIKGTDAYLLKTAALFHDIGFVRSYENHEESSCGIARAVLFDYNFPEDDIESVCDLILATKIPHHPTNILAEVICDADLNYLGEKDFYRIADRLRKELISYHKLDDDEAAWIQYQIRFLEKHRFFTDTCKRQREIVKLGHLNQLKAKLKDRS